MARKGVNIRVGWDLKEFSKSSQNLSRSLKKTGNKLKSVGKSMSTFVTLPILAIGAASIKMASDLEESTNKSDVAFGKSSESVKEFAKTTLKAFGLAESSSLEMASTFGDMGTSMGISQAKAAEMSKALVGVAGDMASFKNISIDRAQTALNAVFTGETESLKTLGIVMTQAELNAFAMAQGINKTMLEMTGAEKVALRYQFILDRTSNSQGDFENTGGNAANQMRIFQETLKELSASFGKLLLPAFTKIIKVVNGFLNYLRELSPETKKIIVIVAALAAAIGPLIFAVGALTTALAFLAANPIVLIITGIIAVLALQAAAIIYVTKNWEALTERFINVAWWRNALIEMSIFFLKNNPFNLMAEEAESFFLKFGIIKVFTKSSDTIIDKLQGMKVEVSKNKHEMKSFGDIVDEVKAKIKKFTSVDFDLGGGDVIKGISKAIGGLSTIKPNITLPIDVKLDLSSIPQQIEMLDLGISKFGDKIADFKQGVKGLLTNFAADVGMFLAEALGDAMSGGFEDKDFGKAALSMLGGFMKQMGALMITYAAEMALFSLSIANPLLWPVALAAGIAMVAAGAAISNLGSEGLGASSSSGGGSAAPAPSYSNNGYTDGVVNSMDVRISGRDLILVQERERAFRR
jgi:hypothetical protein